MGEKEGVSSPQASTSKVLPEDASQGPPSSSKDEAPSQEDGASGVVLSADVGSETSQRGEESTVKKLSSMQSKNHDCMSLVTFTHALFEEIDASARSGDIVKDPFVDELPTGFRCGVIACSMALGFILFVCALVALESLPRTEGDGVCIASRVGVSGSPAAHICSIGGNMDELSRIVAGVKGGGDCPVRGLFSVADDNVCTAYLSLSDGGGSDVEGIHPSQRISAPGSHASCTVAQKFPPPQLTSWESRFEASVDVPNGVLGGYSKGLLDAKSFENCTGAWKQTYSCDYVEESSGQPVIIRFKRTFNSGLGATVFFLVMLFFVETLRHVEAIYPSNACCERCTRDVRKEDGNTHRCISCCIYLLPLNDDEDSGICNSLSYYILCCCVWRRTQYLVAACCANSYSPVVEVKDSGKLARVMYRRQRNWMRGLFFSLSRRAFNFFALALLTSIQIDTCETSNPLIAFTVHDTLANQLLELLINIPFLYYIGLVCIVVGIFLITIAPTMLAADEDDIERARNASGTENAADATTRCGCMCFCCWAGASLTSVGCAFIGYAFGAIGAVIALVFAIPFLSINSFLAFTFGWTGQFTAVFDGASFMIALGQGIALIRMLILEFPTLYPAILSGIRLFLLYFVGRILLIWDGTCQCCRKRCECCKGYKGINKEPWGSHPPVVHLLSSDRVVSYSSSHAKSWQLQHLVDGDQTSERYDIARSVYRTGIAKSCCNGWNAFHSYVNSRPNMKWIGPDCIRGLPEPLLLQEVKGDVPTLNPKYETIADIIASSIVYGEHFAHHTEQGDRTDEADGTESNPAHGVPSVGNDEEAGRGEGGGGGGGGEEEEEEAPAPSAPATKPRDGAGAGDDDDDDGGDDGGDDDDGIPESGEEAKKDYEILRAKWTKSAKEQQERVKDWDFSAHFRDELARQQLAIERLRIGKDGSASICSECDEEEGVEAGSVAVVEEHVAPEDGGKKGGAQGEGEEGDGGGGDGEGGDGDGEGEDGGGGDGEGDGEGGDGEGGDGEGEGGDGEGGDMTN